MTVGIAALQPVTTLRVCALKILLIASTRMRKILISPVMRIAPGTCHGGEMADATRKTTMPTATTTGGTVASANVYLAIWHAMLLLSTARIRVL